MKYFKQGFISVFPIISGIIPFGAVMGSAFSEAKLTFGQAFLMNTSVYAGAAQLAAVDLMKVQAATAVVVVTGLIINLRFLLYSAAMSPYLEGANPLIKFLCAFTLTDQSYATMTAHQDKFFTNEDAVQFYLGTSTCMMIAWNGSVLAGFIFGNFAPKALALEFAIPLSFVALVIPTLKSKLHVIIALFSACVSLLCYNFPLKTGLIVTAILSMSLAWMLIKLKGKKNDR